ncbi:MAG: pyridoxal phosphate-dependent aminotransferase [Actinomycetes bacterium]|jgi:cystathionine beta-lyase|nr:pyridoxal phosphate-dependent aminotransferase [Actinomycetes bacterium]
MFDFDTVIDRYDTDSLKWDYAAKRGVPTDVLPMWVADMDWQAPPAVRQALADAAQFGIFGYSDTRDDYDAILADWFTRYFDWTPEPDWLVKTPGVVPAVYMAVRAFTEPGDAVLIQSPVYYPFREAIHDTGRSLVTNPLVYNTDADRYDIDFDDFEAKVADPSVKLFILCSPHNPVCRVWTRDELARMASLCREHDVIVCSDEIHMDFVFPGNRHTVFAALDPQDAQNCVVATAPSKTFNCAGLQLANVFIPNPELRVRYRRAYVAAGLSQPGLMGIVACKAAYTQGRPWLDEMLVYLQGNFDALASGIDGLGIGAHMLKPQGTYLAWVDFSCLNMKPRELDDWMIHRAKLWLDGGTMFGPEGAGFQRFNLACPRATVQEAIERIRHALNLP